MAVQSAALEADAHIVDRFAVIHFTFIVFFTPRIVIFTAVRFALNCTTLSTHNLFQPNRQKLPLLGNRGRPRESGSLAGACIG
jgi:hypothetical protein